MQSLDLLPRIIEYCISIAFAAISPGPWFFSFVLRIRAHCDPSCLCLVLSRARCSCRCLFVLVAAPFVWLFAMLFFLTFLSRVLPHPCFILSTCILVCALPFSFVFSCFVVVPLLLCTVVTVLTTVRPLCSLRARVMPLCDFMALPSNTNSSILMRCCAGCVSLALLLTGLLLQPQCVV